MKGENKIQALFGLGNPGEEYEQTYHNAGWMFLDYLASKFGATDPRDANLFSWRTVAVDGVEIFIIKPLDVYMNDAGKALMKTKANKAINQIWKNTEDIFVVHDDSDIMLGKFKHSFGASSAGHRGVESIIQSLGNKNFHRIRIGIRKKPGKALGFVLKRISKTDLETLNKVFEGIEALITTTNKKNAPGA